MTMSKNTTMTPSDILNRRRVLSDNDRKRLERALERRYGKSTMPLEIERGAQGNWYVTDVENGARILANFFRGKVRVIREYGPTA
jgi:hypothetical protein